MTAAGVILAAFAIFAIAQGDEQHANIYGMQGIRIFGDTIAKRDFVSEFQALPGFDFLTLPRATDRPIDVLVAPEQLDQFKNALDEKDIEYEVYIEDVSNVLEENLTLQRRARRARVNNIFRSFPRYVDIIRYLKDIAEQYSDVAQTFSIGKSYEGRDLLGLKISSGPDGEKPVVVIDAGIHAREWIAPTTALYTISQLVENSTNHYLFKDVDIYILPSLNPDGYEYTHQNIFTRLWRKTRSHSSNRRCRGVDANRNFDISWMSTGASTNPCVETYAGPKAFSEPETVALRDFMLGLKGKIKTYLSFHSFGQYLLHPYGFTRRPPKTARELKCVGKAAAAEIYKHRGNKYTIGNTIEVLYAASGSSMDWAIAKADAEISYTIELPGGNYGFDPPPREIIPVGRETFDAIVVFIQYAIKGDEVC